MKENRFGYFLEEHFVLFSCVLSLVLALLYGWKGIKEGFLVGTWIVIGLNIVYVPMAFAFKSKCFSYYFLGYSLVMVFVLAFEKTFLFNNFTALFLVCFVILMNQKLKVWALILYFVSVFVAFILNEENLIHFFIHLTRSLWFVMLLQLILNKPQRKKKLVLFNDEKEILNQLSDGTVYQKEVRGFSENTVYRKLKAARERNGNISREELVELYKQEIQEEEK